MKEQNFNEKMLAKEIEAHLEESCAVSLSPSHMGYVVAPLKNFEDCKNIIRYNFAIETDEFVKELIQHKLRVLKVNNGTMLIIVKEGTNIEIY